MHKFLKFLISEPTTVRTIKIASNVKKGSTGPDDAGIER